MPATITIEPLDGSDLLALAHCMALDATVFPHASVPAVGGPAPPRVWIARADDALVAGFVATMRRANRLEIVGVAVDVGHRRAGIGRALLRTAVGVARRRQLAVVTLHVSTANAPAIALYESEGFIANRLLRRFYPPARFAHGGDAWEMVLRLRRPLNARRTPP